MEALSAVIKTEHLFISAASCSISVLPAAITGLLFAMELIDRRASAFSSVPVTMTLILNLRASSSHKSATFWRGQFLLSHLLLAIGLMPTGFCLDRSIQFAFMKFSAHSSSSSCGHSSRCLSNGLMPASLRVLNWWLTGSMRSLDPSTVLFRRKESLPFL